MKFYCIEFENTTVEIELSNHPVVKQWATYQELLSPLLDYRITTWNIEGSETDFNHPKVQHRINQIRRSINFLKLIILDFDFTECENALDEFIKDKNQKWLNIIHRVFTFLTMHRSNLIQSARSKDAVNSINVSVHDLEGLVSSRLSKLRKIYSSEIYLITFTNSIEYANQNGVWKHFINESFDHKTENFDFNVWMSEDILGKDLIRCYLDNDDPNNTDIGGNFFYTPNVLIDTNFAFRNILKSTDFNKWLNKNLKAPKNLNRWPLGNLKNVEHVRHVKDSRVIRTYIKG